jgi:hypothetical protein
MVPPDTPGFAPCPQSIPHDFDVDIKSIPLYNALPTVQTQSDGINPGTTFAVFRVGVRVGRIA